MSKVLSNFDSNSSASLIYVMAGSAQTSKSTVGAKYESKKAMMSTSVERVFKHQLSATESQNSILNDQQVQKIAT